MKPIFLIAASAFSLAASAATDRFTDNFDVARTELTSIGTNRYFVLAPGFELVLEGKEHGKATMLTITVLNETRLIDGVETRVVEERETNGGVPIEISRNFFAISKHTGDVYYFGEEVDIYRQGHIAGHEGAWISGVAGARFGLAFPGTPLLGARYYQELAPNVAMDRAEIISLNAALTTPAGKFENCLETQETSALEKGRERKLYAPGIGLIAEGNLKLTRFGFKSP